MNNYIKTLIEINKTSKETINALTVVINDMEINNDKDKANFGNLCLIMNANRSILSASEAMLENEDVLQDNLGNYYQKIEEDNESINTPSDENTSDKN